MWKGNEAISDLLDLRWNWLENPVKRVISGISAMIVYPLTAMFAINLFFSWLWGWNIDGTTLEGFLNYGLIAVIFTFLISSFLNARRFFLSWRQLAINEEKIKREAITSRYESLKNQVNPHFLFNSLNALTSLVYEDQDLAAKFIKQLSNVYRYVLESKDKELVPLKEEIEFLNSYCFMLKTRHQSGLEIAVNLNGVEGKFIAPLALQMLVENAIKHNQVEKASPLRVNVFEDGGFVVVENNLQKKISTRREEGIGLSNIRSRYEFLTDLAVEVHEDDAMFTVKIPLLDIDKNGRA